MRPLVTIANETSRELVTFGGGEKQDLISFETTFLDTNNQAHIIDIPASQIKNRLPETLSLQEAVKMGIDLSQCRIIEEYCESIDAGPNSNIIVSPPKGITPDQVSEEIITFANTKNVFPQERLDQPNIYKPIPGDKKAFQKTFSGKKESEDITGVNISRFLHSNYKVRLYQDEIYIFNEDKRIYEQYSESDLNYLINKHFGRAIENQDNLDAYSKAKNYLTKNHNLVISKDYCIPGHYWIFQNGLFDTKTGRSFENDGKFFARSVLQCDYNPSASCPNFEQFLDSITGGDEILKTLLLETIGYLLSCDTNGKVLFAFVGKKDTGKSLLAKIITNIIGDDAVSHLSAQEFSGKFDVKDLNDKHLNVCMDLPDKPLSAEAVARIKAITGNDKIRSDVKSPV